MISPELQAIVGAHLVSCYPAEGCGFIGRRDGVDVFLPCVNTADNPLLEFRVDAVVQTEIEDAWEVVALVHSHPDTWARPSDADRLGCEASGFVWIIASVLRHEGEGDPYVAGWQEIAPESYIVPLEGREYAFGVLDCYTLVQDWYQRERGIALPHFERRDAWWNDGKSDLFTEHFCDAGFAVVPLGEPLQVGDVILMEIKSKNGVPNHSGVLLGRNHLLHHPYRRLSRIDVYGGMWAQYTRMVVRRHEDFH